MTELAVRVLGGLSVNALDVAHLDKKARSLLLLLALARGSPVPVDALVDALWGDIPPSRPHDQVAVLASRVRRLLGRSRVERTDQGYRLRADWIDLVELDVVVREAERRLEAGETGTASAARAVLALLGGSVPEVRSETTWAAAEYAAAIRLVQRARRVAAAGLLAAGEWRDALDLAAADLAADPFDEQAARAVMLAHAAAGRPAQALSTYATLRTTLADELGTDPAAETAELHTAILRGDLPVTRPAMPVPTLVGRDSQLAHLDSLVPRAAATRVPRVALVSGEAGIGKTTLLTSWAAKRRSLGDRVLLGTCGPLDRAAPLDVLLSALAADLREVDTSALLGADAAVLAPLLGTAEPTTRSVDPALGPAVLYGAVSRVIGRIAGDRAAVVVIDDAHLAGPTLADWLTYLRRRPLPIVVVLGARPEECPDLPVTDHVGLGPLDRAHVAALVGEQRADELHARSGGHPLFLAELASVPSGELPESLVAALTARCDQLQSAGGLVRTAAVLGDELDIDLLAGILGRGTLDVLTDAERAVRGGLLMETSGRLRFRHDLVRTALVSGTSLGRTAALHREAGRALARRRDVDPAMVAEHALLGGDRDLAAQWLRIAADRAAERFDYATAEDLLDQSLAQARDDTTLLARARVRIQRRRYRDAEADAVAARDAGPLRWEAAAWAAYFDRRFDDAASYADDGALAAEDAASRARCLVASGRILHARGELSRAGQQLDAALHEAKGGDRLEAAAWRGVLHAHRSEIDQALMLLRPATRPGIGVAHTSASMHALLFTGHTFAVAGRAQEALACFADYTAEVARRDVPRFAGRGVNFSGWVLRNLGAVEAGVDAHQEAAADAVDGVVIPEVLVAALEDLAEERIRADDPDRAARFLDQARAAFVGDLVFGWRLAMKLQLLEAQVQLLRGEPESALRVAEELASAAARALVPRYEACARLLVHRAAHALGEPVESTAVRRDLGRVERAVGIEAWWWAGSTGAALGDERWLARSEELVADLARRSGDHGDELRAGAARQLERWRSAAAVRSR